MARYPSKKCEKCPIVLERKQAEKDVRNEDGSWKYPVFEIAMCSCLRLPDGYLDVDMEDEKEEV